MPPKLYFDHDMNLTVVPDLRADGYDVKTTPEAKNERASDEKQLDYATREGRVLVTYNRKDFRRLHRRYLSSGKEHAGILVSRQLPRNQLLLRLRNFLQRVSADQMRNRLEKSEELCVTPKWVDFFSSIRNRPGEKKGLVEVKLR